MRGASTLVQAESNESTSLASLNVTTIDAEGIDIQFHEHRDDNAHQKNMEPTHTPVDSWQLDGSRTTCAITFRSFHFKNHMNM